MRPIARLSLLGVPLLLVALGKGRCADRLGGSLGMALQEIGAPFEVSPVDAGDDAEPALLEAALGEGIEALPFAAEAKATDGRRSLRRGSGRQPLPEETSTAAPPRDVWLSGERLLRLVEAGFRPRARPVGPAGLRPAGLALSALGGARLGLRDGDVLTEVEGVPVRSEAEVAELVVSLRGRGVRVIHGRFWRGDQRFVVAVEQPYLFGEGLSPSMH
jgi:hypothetical protein